MQFPVILVYFTNFSQLILMDPKNFQLHKKNSILVRDWLDWKVVFWIKTKIFEVK